MAYLETAAAPVNTCYLVKCGTCGKTTWKVSPVVCSKPFVMCHTLGRCRLLYCCTCRCYSAKVERGPSLAPLPQTLCSVGTTPSPFLRTSCQCRTCQTLFLAFAFRPRVSFQRGVAGGHVLLFSRSSFPSPFADGGASDSPYPSLAGRLRLFPVHSAPMAVVPIARSLGWLSPFCPLATRAFAARSHRGATPESTVPSSIMQRRSAYDVGDLRSCGR